MRKLRLVHISKEYIEYIGRFCNSFSRKPDGALERPYMLIPGEFDGHSYCIPLTSPRRADYVKNKDGTLDIKDDFVTRMRFSHKHHKTGQPEVLGCLSLARMIPVPPSEIIPCIINHPKHSTWQRFLLNREWDIAEEKIDKILKNVDVVYLAATGQSAKSEEIMAAIKGDVIDFRAANEACSEFEKLLSKGFSSSDILASVAHLPLLFTEGAPVEDTPSSSKHKNEKSEEQQGAVGVSEPSSPQSPKISDSHMKSCMENRDKFKFVYVSEHYSNYLAQCYSPDEESNDNGMTLEGHRDGRMFIQVPYTFNGHNYCIPLSSPKLSDYYVEESGRRVPKPNSTHIMRVVFRRRYTGGLEVKFTLRFCRMIPVPVSEIIPYDHENETRQKYKDLIDMQKTHVAGQYSEILTGAVELYNMRVRAIPRTNTYVNMENCLFSIDFKAAEHYCKMFEECLAKGINKEDIADYVMLGKSATDAAHRAEKESYSDEVPGCSTWGESVGHRESRMYEDYSRKYSDSPDGGVKRKHDGDDEPRSVRSRLSDSHVESGTSSKSYSGKGKGLGKGRSRQHAPTR